MKDYLPRLSKTFWAYLRGLDEDVERLLGLLERERLSLLGKEFNKILHHAREKEELLKRIANGEERLSTIIRQILKKLDRGGAAGGSSGDDGGDTLRAFKEILAFKDFLRFEAWYASYMKKREEVRQKNLRNLKWAQEGLKESIEISRILMGQTCGGRSQRALLYDQRGAIKEGRG